MRTICKSISYASRGDMFKVHILPDVHLGNAACSEALLDKFVETVRSDPFARWVGVGDYAEWINRRDKRYDPASVAPWLQAGGDMAKLERDAFIEHVRPIAGQCLGLVKGNHEDTMLLYSERDVYQAICESMGAGEHSPLALGFSGFLRISFARCKDKGGNDAWALDMFLTHGWWGGRLRGNGELNLERLFGWVEADIVISGHDHKGGAYPIARIRPAKNGGVEQVDGWCIGAGTLLGQATYAETRGYRPTPLGWKTLIIEPAARAVRVLQ